LHEPKRGVLLNVGRVAGGGALNRVPDHAVLQLNTRVVDDEAMQRIEESLQRIADEFTVGDYRVSLTGTFSSPPKLVSAEIRALQKQVETAGDSAGRKITWQDTGGACDGCKLAAFGLPNIDTMGVSGGNLHSPDEFCDLDSIVPAAMTVAAFIRNRCSVRP
jgi:glutamate carboxypeptidase